MKFSVMEEPICAPLSHFPRSLFMTQQVSTPVHNTFQIVPLCAQEILLYNIKIRNKFPVYPAGNIFNKKLPYIVLRDLLWDAAGEATYKESNGQQSRD